jgi:hypothetical protein
MAVAGLARAEDRLTAAMDEVAERPGPHPRGGRRRHRPRGRGRRRRAGRRELGPVDLLVNNAGLIDAAEVPLWEADPDQWWDVVAEPRARAFLLVRAVVAGMLARARPSVNSAAAGAGRAAGRTRLLRRQERADAASPRRSPGARGQRRARVRPRPGRRGHPDDRSDAEWRGRTEWTRRRTVVEFVAAIAAGELDQWSGRFLRVGADDLAPCEASRPERRRPAAAAALLRGRRPARLTATPGARDPVAAQDSSSAQCGRRIRQNGCPAGSA